MAVRLRGVSEEFKYKFAALCLRTSVSVFAVLCLLNALVMPVICWLNSNNVAHRSSDQYIGHLGVGAF